MYVFVDVFKEACATCVFLRIDTSQGIKVVLVRAKSRVAPLKQVTILRLELMACCIGARLAHSVQQALSSTEMETILLERFHGSIVLVEGKRGMVSFRIE
ncbi:hypothetical protein AVEN_203951-1 [Araneus ventricosus]|uniref:Uncharacterized protein n=1 Tax=Araneus ventricosus TaxID=182803 RepID=A0A4Y2U6F0_ARAVE|nr:hypothetical protein AVEN_261017-1 [Araneus ventricosus]GBO07653.1 hypothetical protein AVEN_37476-1 [Araneus ventricosus]GBO07661.1 hypothetical protein AVEN_141049-1 [Araneus ventricosus]GBO07669.1 hypothetical protein AVEN_203951-1 [Araneus ventricosus]